MMEAARIPETSVDIPEDFELHRQNTFSVCQLIITVATVESFLSKNNEIDQGLL
jgi:hypothetical protein